MKQWLELVNTVFKDQPIKPSSPDSRDWPLQAITELISGPVAATLRHYNQGILNQYTSPLCGGYSGAELISAFYGISVSPRFIYWQAKLIDGIPDLVGTTLRAVLQVLQKIGACPESLCPSWPDWSKPVFTDEMMAEAAKYKIKSYARLNIGTLDEIQQTIASGRMVLAGSLVTTDDWNDGDGWILQPLGTKRGTHAHVLDEYNKNLTHEQYKNFAGGPNSWGPDWGDMGGFLQMAEAFAEWRDLDFGSYGLMEAWCVEFDQLFVPKYPAQTYQFDIAPVIIEGRTMVELRSLSNIAGVKRIDYDGAAKKVTLNYLDKAVELQIGQKEYTVTPK